MIELIYGLFVAIILLPGFICIFIPYRLAARELKYSKFELTLASLGISVIILFLAITFYQILFHFSLFVSPAITISTVTIGELLDNFGFMVLFFFWTAIFFGLMLFIIPQDRFVKFRNWLRGKQPEDKHAIVKTATNGEYFIGYFTPSKPWGVNEKEIKLKNPEKYDFNTHNSTLIPINKIISILLRNEDIKRIYFIGEDIEIKHKNYEIKEM